MDLPLWDTSDDQDHQTSYQSGNNTEDHPLYDYSFGYGRDMMEEDALNKKSCLQVLKILIDKADEEIVKLEEDIVILQCQLAWDDEDWSKTCSAVLKENIDYLDILIQILKELIAENICCLDLQLERPVRLHDLLKPLLESYLAKSNQNDEQPESMEMPLLPAEGLGIKISEPSTSKDNNEIEENECTIMLETNDRESQSVDFE